MERLEVIRLGWSVSNVWLLPRTEIGPVLIDCGLSALWPAIRRKLSAHGLEPRDLSAVLLTHLHSDHAGSAARLAAQGVPVYAHPADGEVLSGRAPRSRLEPVGRGVTALLCRIENRFPAVSPVVQPLDEGTQIAGLEVIWMPGHTAGSIFLYHRPSATLFSGDTILNAVPPITARTGLALPYPPFCRDYARAIDELRSFLERKLKVSLLCPGHGPARRGPIENSLEELLARA